MPKIIIKDEHISDAISKGIPVTDILAQAYGAKLLTGSQRMLSFRTLMLSRCL